MKLKEPNGGDDDRNKSARLRELDAGKYERRRREKTVNETIDLLLVRAIVFIV